MEMLPVRYQPKTSDFDEIVSNNVLRQVSKKSKAIYKNDMQIFDQWLADNGLQLKDVGREEILAYHDFLETHYERASAARMFSVMRRVLDEAVYRHILPANPAKEVKGFKVDNESPHTALTKQEARELLQSIDRSSILGIRDYAMLSLLLRTGIRRSECAALNIGDIKMEQGHHIAVIQHGKGDKRRNVKIPVDVFKAIETYLRLANRENSAPDAPLFCGCTRGRKSTNQRVSDKLIERTVEKYRGAVNAYELTPHGLRATFNTLAREGGASLEQRQYAMGHADPRTTQRYDRRKVNLDDNAVDYIKL